MFVGKTRMFGYCFFLICKRGIWNDNYLAVLIEEKKTRKDQYWRCLEKAKLEVSIWKTPCQALHWKNMVVLFCQLKVDFVKEKFDFMDAVMRRDWNINNCEEVALLLDVSIFHKLGLLLCQYLVIWKLLWC